MIDLDDPVEVGKEAVYEIRVTNQGTGACTNVQLVAALAEGTEYKGSSGPTQVKPQGQHLVFDPIPTLAAKGEAVYPREGPRHDRGRTAIPGATHLRSGPNPDRKGRKHAVLQGVICRANSERQ